MRSTRASCELRKTQVSRPDGVLKIQRLKNSYFLKIKLILIFNPSIVELLVLPLVLL
jgi:hypothetical protein